MFTTLSPNERDRAIVGNAVNPHTERFRRVETTQSLVHRQPNILHQIEGDWTLPDNPPQIVNEASFVHGNEFAECGYILLLRLHHQQAFTQPVNFVLWIHD